MSIILGISSGTWLYTKIIRHNNNPQSSAIAAAVCGVVIAIFSNILFKSVLERNI